MSLSELFSTAQLPYNFVHIPKEDEPSVDREKRLKTYVNKVITDLSKEAYNHCGFDITEDTVKFNAGWGRQYTLLQYSAFKPWQKINHFAGANMMGRKDTLHARMSELRSRIGDEASFYPESFKLPDQEKELKEAWHKYKLWIVKPVAQARGIGIHVVSSEDSEPPKMPDVIVQRYVENPMLITGRKFDLRLYVMVSSAFPLRIYMHDSGLVRFATRQYDVNASPDDVHTHLTNFSLNKTDENFVRAVGTEESIEDSKWSIPFFIKYLDDNGIDSKKVFENLERVTIGTMIAGFCSIRNHHSHYVKHRQNTSELFGIDIMLDENLKPYVMEVNISPAMSGKDSDLDYMIKNRLMHDVLRIQRIIDCDADERNPCPGLIEVEELCRKSLTRERVRAVENASVAPWKNPVFADFMLVRDFIEESERNGGFRLVYPCRENFSKFLPFFDRMKYHDIVLTEWIKLSEEERYKVINEHFGEYKEQLEQICKSL